MSLGNIGTKLLQKHLQATLIDNAEADTVVISQGICFSCVTYFKLVSGRLSNSKL
jgi:hypothetical protein